MAPSPVIKDRGAAGDLFFRVIDLTLDATYAVGGWPLTAQQLGFGLNGVIFFVDVGSKSGYIFEWDQVNTKLKAYQGDNANVAAAPAVEVPANAAGLNGLVLRVLAFGKGSPG